MRGICGTSEMCEASILALSRWSSQYMWITYLFLGPVMSYVSVPSV